MVLSKSERDSINRIISLCHALMTLSRRGDLRSPALYCRDRRPRLCGISSFFRRRKKKQKSRWDTCDCVPNPATLFGKRGNKRSFSHCRDRRPRLSEKNGGGSKPPPYKSEGTPCTRTNKPNLKAPLSKGSWRRQATEGLLSFVFRIGVRKK